MEEVDDSASYHTFLKEFEVTKKELEDAENHIKRIIGRDPDQYPNDALRGFGLDKWKTHPGAVPCNQFPGKNKRPLFPIVKGKRLPYQEEDSPDDEEKSAKRPSLPSTVVATKDIKSRKETIEEQNVNSKVEARNRRMFGMIVGTLQKFQHDAKKREEKDLKRAEIEQKVEAAAAEEKERIKKEKEELFQTRREKQTQLRCLEKKMEIAEIYEDWENSLKNTVHFIKTTSQPPVYFLPALHTPETEKCLQESKAQTLECIKQRRENMEKELQEVEEWYKKDNFPSNKENIGPIDDSELGELPIALVETQDSQGKSPETSLTVQNNNQDHPDTHEEMQITLPQLQDSPKELQNTSQELQESLLDQNTSTSFPDHEMSINTESTGKSNNGEIVADDQACQDFEPNYD